MLIIQEMQNSNNSPIQVHNQLYLRQVC